MEPKSVALASNATGFAGRPTIQALLDSGVHVLVHDPAFADPGVWRGFAPDRADLDPIDAGEPEAIVAHGLDFGRQVAALVSKDHQPAPSYPLVVVPLDELSRIFEKPVEFPFRLVRAILHSMRQQGGGNIVMVTSNRTRSPLSNAARAAANAMVRSLAIDCAGDGIMVNAVAPSFLYSEAYHPSALFKAGETGRAYVRQSVPVDRLAEPEEIGEVVAFLATVRTRFLTGAVTEFSGGWPFGRPRPSG